MSASGSRRSVFGPRVRNGNDSGSLTAFVVLFSVALFALLGLLAEGGTVLDARIEAVTEAEQAARAGAAVLSPATLHSGGLLDRNDGPVTAAEAVMASYGHPGVATVTGSVVRVTVRPFSVPTPLLALVGISTMTVGATATARPVAG